MKILLKGVRLSFAHIFQPEAFEGSDPRYSANFLIPKDAQQLAAIEKAIETVANEKWGAKAQGNLALLRKTDKVALRDGDTKPDYDGYEGNMFLSTANRVRPTIVDRDRRRIEADEGRPYAGCYVNASVDIWAQDNKFGKRINARLLAIQFVRDGEAFAGGAPGSPDDFEDLSMEDDGSDLV